MDVAVAPGWGVARRGWRGDTMRRVIGRAVASVIEVFVLVTDIAVYVTITIIISTLYRYGRGRYCSGDGAEGGRVHLTLDSERDDSWDG